MALNFTKPKQNNTVPILEKINNSKVCSPMNKLIFKNGKAWLNPNNQECFNSGNFTEEDFDDWLDGKGSIVKGRDDEEKAIVWEYATFKEEYYSSFTITSNYKFFYLVSTDYRPNYNTSVYGNGGKSFTPFVYDGKNQTEIISNIFANFVMSLKRDLLSWDDERSYNRVRDEFRKETWGITKTLMLMGIGYCGASNTPESIENLSWFSGVVFGKAYYLALKEKGVKFPNFDFMDNNRYKI